MIPALFRTDEFAELVGMDSQQLRNWVAAGVINPVMRGTGRGSVHLFSGQQALAMAAVAVLADSTRGCNFAYARKILAAYEGMPDRVLNYLVGGPGADDRDEEEWHRWKGADAHTALLDPTARDGPWDDGEQASVNERISAAFRRVEEAVRAKLTPAGRRPGPRGPASRMKGKRAERAN
jgi:DNA-binding transcriptional MerR regulator